MSLRQKLEWKWAPLIVALEIAIIFGVFHLLLPEIIIEENFGVTLQRSEISIFKILYSAIGDDTISRSIP